MSPHRRDPGRAPSPFRRPERPEPPTTPPGTTLGASGARGFRRLRVALALVVALGSTATGATPSGAATDEQIATATARAVSWIRDRQDPATGVVGCVSTVEAPCASNRPNPFGGDWSLLGLAGAGVHAADLRVGAGPSAQDWYRQLWGDADESSWTGLGQQQASDFARTILVAHAAGLPPTRISSTRNLVAGLAGYFRNGTGYFAAPGLENQHLFALLALEQTAVASSPAGEALIARLARLVASFEDDERTGLLNGVVDLQGAALAALCGAGRTTSDPVVARGVANLLDRRASNGGLGNSSSTGWALGGLAACGITRGSAAWQQHGLEATLDHLLAQQIASSTEPGQVGGFTVTGQTPANARGDLYATQDGLRALKAPGFAVPPPARSDEGPVTAAAPAVPDGTEVPVALVVDPGHEDVALRDHELRLCSGTAPVGASLRVVLDRLRVASKPAGCAVDPQWDGDRLVALNGRRTAAGGAGWRLSLDGAAEQPAREQRVGFGDVVALRLADPSPELVPPSVGEPPREPSVDPPAAPPTDPPTTPPADPTPTPPGAVAPVPRPTSPTAPADPGRAAATRRRVTVACRLTAARRGARCTVRSTARTTAAIAIPGGRRQLRRTGGSRLVLTVPSRRRLRTTSRATVRLTVAGRTRTVTVRLDGRTVAARV